MFTLKGLKHFGFDINTTGVLNVSGLIILKLISQLSFFKQYFDILNTNTFFITFFQDFFKKCHK